MLLEKSKVFYLGLIIFVSLLFSACSSKNYYTENSGYYKKRDFRQVPKQEIRNSEAMHRATMRPYTIAGKLYQPTLAKVGDRFSGIASWYGPNFHAKKTSNGEIYNMFAMTAAHKTLPMNTMVKVDNLENGKSTTVRINDRGPFVTGRIIDLSNKAAHEIDMVDKGTAKIRLTVLGFHAKIAKTQAEKEEVASVGKYFVQVGAFRRLEGAKITQKEYQQMTNNKYEVIIKEGEFQDKPINRVWVSGFRSEEEANDFKKEYNINGAMVIAE